MGLRNMILRGQGRGTRGVCHGWVMGFGSSPQCSLCQRVALHYSATNKHLDCCPLIAVFRMFILVTAKAEKVTMLMVDQGAGRERA